VNAVDVPFYRRVEDALTKTRMRQAVRHTSGRAMESRRAAIAELDSSDAIRDQARAIRSRTLAALDQHLDTFATNVEKNGGTVFFAETGEDAVEYIRRLARDRGIRTIVKGKSMVSEEIELNPVLELDGFEVVETDLGEYIVQLDGDKPSHIVAPILHKTKEDCARVFKEKLGASDEDVAGVPQMTQLARRTLRKAFLKADMGITGGNFLIAETGTVVLISNEGNARLTTSVPRIMVSIVGIEKVIPKLSDLPIFLKVAPDLEVGAIDDIAATAMDARVDALDLRARLVVAVAAAGRTRQGTLLLRAAERDVGRLQRERRDVWSHLHPSRDR